MATKDASFSDRAKKIGLISVVILAALFLISFVVVGLLDQVGVKTFGLATRSSGISAPGAPNFFEAQFYSADGSINLKGGSVRQAADIAVADRKVIKSGSLELLVKNVEETAKDVQAAAERAGGFVAGVDIYDVAQDAKSGTIVIRVPADRFSDVLEGIKKLAVKVERENVNSQDVTEQHVDLESRLKNLKAQEAQYLEIMKKAETIEEVLNVSSRLGETRGQIEQIQGQLKYLAGQVDLASVSVSLVEEGDVEVFGINWRPLYVAKQALRGMIAGLAGYVDSMIIFIFQLPLILLWLVTIGLIIIALWKVARWAWEKINNHQTLIK